MRKRTTKSLLAIIMTVVLVFGMAVPSFAVYGYEDGGRDNSAYADGAAEQTATPSDLPTTETQTTTPAALTAIAEIQPLNAPIIPPGRTININTPNTTGAVGWNFSGGVVNIMESGAFRIEGNSTPTNNTISVAPSASNVQFILYNANHQLNQTKAAIRANTNEIRPLSDRTLDADWILVF